MKRNFNRFAFITIGVIALVLSNHMVFTNSTQPITGVTGAPGEQTCGRSGCHNTTPNTGPGEIVIDVSQLANGYTPGGGEVNIIVTVNDNTKSRYGFELTALDEQNNAAGSFALVNTNNTGMQSSGGRNYVFHRNASSINAWTFKWTPPASDLGEVTFYAAGNAANNNGTSSGDNIYTASVSVMPAVPSGLADKGIMEVRITPSPVTTDFIGIHLTATQQKQVETGIYDMSGKLLTPVDTRLLQAGNNVIYYPIRNDLPGGLYILQLKTDGESLTKKILLTNYR